MDTKQSGIRWVRVLVAGLLAEIVTIVVIILVVTIYNFTIGSGQTEAQKQAFAAQAGFYVAPIASIVLTFLFAFWVARKVESKVVLHGTLAGVVATLLRVGFIFAAQPKARLMYVASYILKLLSGYAGGVLAQKRLSGVKYG